MQMFANQMLGLIQSKLDTEKEGTTGDKLLTPDHVNRVWRLPYMSEWARLFSLVRYALSKKSKKENEVAEFVDDIIQFILLRDSGSEEQAFQLLKTAVNNLADDDNKRINHRIIALANIMSPTERIKQNEAKKEKK
jgi:hypothetical protein